MNPALNLVLERIEHLVNRAKFLKRRGEESLSDLLLEEARSLASSMDNDDEQLLVMSYHRYSSDSFGLDFEITHGDPELMFGGVV
jgi:hypothetical protein